MHKVSMRERVLLLIPTAGFTGLLVLFVVLWQASQHQSNSLQRLNNRLQELEHRGDVNSRQLLDQQLSVLKTRQQKLQSEIQSLQTLQSESAEREARLLETLRRRVPRPFTTDETADFDQAIPTPFNPNPSAPSP